MHRFNGHFRLFESSAVNELEVSDLLMASIDTPKGKKLDSAPQIATYAHLLCVEQLANRRWNRT